jgi:hypothetical protein
MNDERDEPHLTGQIAGVIAMMSALVKALPPSTRKRLLRQTHAEFESLLAVMSAKSTSQAHIDREGIEWMRDLFLKRIAEADSKQKNRKVPKAAEDAGQPAPTANRSPAVERPSSTEIDFEL